jgi:hypothetical protein
VRKQINLFNDQRLGPSRLNITFCEGIAVGLSRSHSGSNTDLIATNVIPRRRALNSFQNLTYFITIGNQLTVHMLAVTLVIMIDILPLMSLQVRRLFCTDELDGVFHSWGGVFRQINAVLIYLESGE